MVASTSTSSTSPRRPSKFIESLPSSSSTHDAAPQTPTNSLFFSILSEMDEFEVRRQQQNARNRGASQSSLESETYMSASTSSPSRSYAVKEGRRSINFTRGSLDKELEGRERRRSGSGSVEGEEGAGDKFAKKFVGRLRALTGGRERDGKRESGS